MESRSIRPLSLTGDPSSSETPHTRQISLKKGKNLPAQGESYRRATTIDLLSDDILLEIFDSYRKVTVWDPAWPWHLLVHVCQRWRQVIFASPHRLNLQLLCTFGTPVKKDLGIWPPFPIIVDYPPYRGKHPTPNDEDNVIAALEHHNRVCYVNLKLTSPQLARMATAMQEPFPALKYLSISKSFSVEDGNAPVLPTESLGGCAPCLQKVTLFGIPYPALPTLLLSSSHLVALRLHCIPLTGFISPETLVVGLAALPRLECFILDFQSIMPSPYRTPPPLAARTVLPSLTSFEFRGTSEYLENLVARVDSPHLDQILITYLDQPDNFQVGQLSKFISRSVGPHLALFKHAEVTLYKDRRLTAFDMTPSPYYSFPYSSCAGPGMRVLCDWSLRRVSPLAQVLSQFSAALSNVVHLKLMTRPAPRLSLGGTSHDEWPSYDTWTYDFEWRPLLRQFLTAETLCVSRDLAKRIASALESSVSEETAAVDALPSLDSICLVGQPASSIEKFLAVRQLSGRPVTVFDTEWELPEHIR